MNVLKRYIRDIFYGANDGVVTTFAIVTGAIGASLGNNVILILGFANLLADGFSMAASNYLGIRSEYDASHAKGNVSSSYVYKHAAATFISFVLAGSLPLMPFVFGKGGFLAAAIATAITLFVIGAMLGKFILHRKWFTWGFQMLVVGGVASGTAYLIGRTISQLIGA